MNDHSLFVKICRWLLVGPEWVEFILISVRCTYSHFEPTVPENKPGVIDKPGAET